MRSRYPFLGLLCLTITATFALVAAPSVAAHSALVGFRAAPTEAHLLFLPLAYRNPVPPTSTCNLSPMFPADNVWNARVDTLPVDPNSQTYVNRIGASLGLHADFGAGLWKGGPVGIPYAAVPATQPLVPVSFTWPHDSERGPYPIPANAPIEGGPNSTGDRRLCQHLL